MEKKIIAIDIGGTKIRAAIANKNLLENVQELKTPKTKIKFLSLITNLIGLLDSKNIYGIAIACPGPLKEGMIINPPNIPLKNFNLKLYLEKKFKKTVSIENDAKCAALAEYKFGMKKENMVILTLGTGIGGGAIINGELFQKNNIGSEFGFIYIEKEKSLESLASSKAITSLSKKYYGKELNFEQINKINDYKSKIIKKLIAKNIAIGISSLVNIFNPDVVVLTGGMTKTKSDFIFEIKKESEKKIILPKKYPIVVSKIKHSSLLGASLLFSNQ